MSNFTLIHTALAMSAFTCAGCALPQSAPIAINVEQATNPSDADYYLVPLIPQIVDIIGERREVGFPAAFRLARYTPSIALKPGDVISVMIFEVSPNPTFGAAPAPQKFGQASHSQTAAKPANTQGSDPLDTSPNGTIGDNSSRPAPGLAQVPPAPPQPTPPGPMPNAAPTSKLIAPLTVESDGDILIPFAGRVHVGGLTPIRAAMAINQTLSDISSNTQVSVSFVSNGANMATVGGEVYKAGPVVLTLRGERLLDAVGQAGGSKWPAPDTSVDIVRGPFVAKVNLQTIVDDPSEDVFVRPNDQIFLTHDPRSFTVLGASQKVSQYTFDVPRVSLAEAVGRAGGAIDTIGNPAAIYLFREEPAKLAQEVLAVSQALTPTSPYRPEIELDARRVKIVYKINLNSGEGYFLARRMTMIDKDVVLIANAEGTQLLKLFTLARGVTGAVNDLSLLGPGGALSSSTTTAITTVR